MKNHRYTLPPSELADWPTWARENAPRLLAPGGVENATLFECQKLFGALERQDRFCEGSMRAAEEDGTLGRLRRRIDELLEESEGQNG